MRTLLVAVFTLVLVTPGHQQQRNDLDSPKALGEWITFYYQHPEPQRIVDAVLSASRLGLLRGKTTAPPMFGFLAGWFSENNDATDTVFEKLVDLPSEDLAALIAGLWYSEAPASMTVLAKYAPRMPSQRKLIADRLAARSHGIAGIALEEGAWVLDALWGNFSATGKEAPVVRIMAALPWSTLKQSDRRRLPGEAARWSLTSNAVQHPRVLAICREQISRQPKDVATVVMDAAAKAPH